MRRSVLFAAPLAAALLAAFCGHDAQAARSTRATGVLRAGVATLDASWHVGASAGQYASDGTSIGSHGVDPHSHSTRRASSYGIQSRLSVRALVVEGPDGKRFALVKNDLYIPQDLLWRRTAELLEERGTSGIGRSNLTIAVTHDHSSPYYSSPSWGVWLFQDVFDARFFEYYAERMARAVELAARHLEPVRVGASVSTLDKPQRHSFGPATADDGSPAGYHPASTDHDLIVVRFDRLKDGRPLAVLVNYSLHPEFLSGNDLISGDYVAPLERMVDRATGATTIFTQAAVGSTEPDRDGIAHPRAQFLRERLEFSHREYAQAEWGARLIADVVLDTWRDIARGTPQDKHRFVPFQAGRVPVAFLDRWYPGPFSHPYPGVSNCRSDQALAGNPKLPIVGLPDCESPTEFFGFPKPPYTGISTDTFQQFGIPVPENYSAPSYTGLEEDVNVHLQAARIGDILFTICSCEQWFEQSLNIKTRTDRIAHNEYVGYDWTDSSTDLDPFRAEVCQRISDAKWRCPYQQQPVDDQAIRRMRAQVRNPANGWNNLENAAQAESEPTNAEEIKGNFTHDDDDRSARLGYGITVPIAMANDYNGYIATYREYQRGDHYRKALTGWGPHAADYMATRLVTLGRLLRDPSWPLPRDQIQEQALAGKITADLAKNDRAAHALGEMGAALTAAYESRLPADGGRPAPLRQPPRVIERFDAATFSWIGGNNFTDNPEVVVQRRVGKRWQNFADQSGEIVVTLRWPVDQSEGAPADVAEYAFGRYEWQWTAIFEVFAAPFDVGMGSLATPPGVYRFVVRGRRRTATGSEPYRVVSREFEVRPWSGITVEDLQLERDGSVSLRVGPRGRVSGTGLSDPGDTVSQVEVGPIDYPDTWRRPGRPRFIDPRRYFVRDPQDPDDPARFEWYCLACSFRPWVDSGDAAQVVVTVQRASGATKRVPAQRAGERWLAKVRLCAGDVAFVERGGVRDRYGNFNGSRSAVVTGTRRC